MLSQLPLNKNITETNKTVRGVIVPTCCPWHYLVHGGRGGGGKFRQDKTGPTGTLEVENGRALYIGSLNRPLLCILKKKV